KVREVVPMMILKEMPNSPGFIAGLFNYRGTIVPVIDLCRLIHGRPCSMRLSTRIILVDYLRTDGTPFILGLMAERVTEAVRISPDAIISAGLKVEGAPYLGGVVMEKDDMIKYIDVDKLPNSFQLLPMVRTNGNQIPDLC
ncbi:MAG: chemotaxis protein CheW, partial [Pseudomonadota bacterium]